MAFGAAQCTNTVYICNCWPHFDKEAARVSGQPLRGDRSKPVLLLAGSPLSRYFVSEVRFNFLDAFTYAVTYEGYDFSAGFLGQSTNGDFWILNESLLNQAGFSEELGDTAGNHFLNDFGWLSFYLFF